MADSPLFLPDWLEPELESGDLLDDIKARIQSKNWLTEGLLAEITSAFPTANDVQLGTGVRNKDKFESMCEHLFPPGCVFASNKQVEQAASRFLEAWAVHSVHDGKKIMCHFGVSFKKKAASKKIDDGMPTRDIIISKKDSTKCPFRILYSWVDFNKYNKKPGIFYRCRITTLRLAHTCQMNPQEHRIAIQKSGSLEVDVSGMKDILSMMQEKPHVRADVI